MPDYRFHFGLGRMLLLMAALGAWLAALPVLSGPWIVWLSTAVFYLAVLLFFSPREDSPRDDGRSAGKAGG